MSDLEIRSKIAQLLTGRCNNCYSRLPGPVGCSVHSPGWNWVTPNFGPFCNDCFKELTPQQPERPKPTEPAPCGLSHEGPCNVACGY